MNKTLSTLWFKYLTSRFLIYNTCWEDPIVDRFLLKIKDSSNILMITSAGDNAFDYLLDKPASIDCIDINPYQNTLLELKSILFKNGTHEHLSELFLTGKTENYQEIFSDIFPHLNEFSLKFWRLRAIWFSPKKGFYKQGLTGLFAEILKKIIHLKGLSAKISELIHEESVDKRKKLFNEKIEPILWRGLGTNIWKSDFILGLAGIPYTQSSSISDLNSYIKVAIENLFVNQGCSNNYFWRLYFEGNYTPLCCPNYLKQEYFNDIRDQVNKIRVFHQSVTSFLRSTNKRYSHFVLLDHQDWLIGDGTNRLEKEWSSLLKAAEPNAKILFRTVHKNLNFLPDFVKNRTTSIPIDKNYLIENDRVGTYPSTYLLKVNV